MSAKVDLKVDLHSPASRTWSGTCSAKSMFDTPHDKITNYYAGRVSVVAFEITS
jgi:hypothetical protein